MCIDTSHDFGFWIWWMDGWMDGTGRAGAMWKKAPEEAFFRLVRVSA